MSCASDFWFDYPIDPESSQGIGFVFNFDKQKQVLQLKNLEYHYTVSSVWSCYGGVDQIDIKVFKEKPTIKNLLDFSRNKFPKWMMLSTR